MIGANGGGQNNILLFEAGYVFRTSDPDVERIVTLAVHPLVVAPQQIAYADNSRSSVTQTLDRSSRLVSSRANRVVQINGMFGVENRGFGAYTGTGYVRWQRFYNEIVRWSDCRNQASLDELINDLTGSVAIRERLRDFDSARCTPFVNFYDLFNVRQFTINADSWTDSIQARMGGATGNRLYTFRFSEAGPIVASRFADKALEGLFSGQQIFRDAIGVLQSYDFEAVAGTFTSIPTLLLSTLATTTGAVADKAEKARNLFGGTRRATLSPPLTAFFGQAQRAVDAAEQIADLVEATEVYVVAPPPGYTTQTQWLAEEPEAFTGIQASQTMAALYDVQDACAQLLRMGAFFGLDQTAYADIIATGGASQRAVVLQTITHVVSATDTPQSLEARYGATFAAILDANDLMPDDALFAGARLTIPLQQSSGPRFISGLPVFGDQSDRAAWGTDLTLALDDDGDGDFAIASGAPILVQGVTFIEEQGAAQMIELAQSAGTASQVIVGAKLTETLLSDRRIDSVPKIEVSSDPQGASIRVDLEITPINSRQSIALEAN